MNRKETWIGLSLTLALALSLLTTEVAQADDWIFGASYVMGIPVGDTKDFVDKASFRGAAVEGRNFTNRNLSLGGYFGWNVFNKNEVTTSTIDNVTVTGDQFRYINSFPILFLIHYYPGDPRAKTRPYLGGGLGGYVYERRLEVGTVAFQQNNWHWGLAPEVGLMTELNRDTNAYLSVKFNYAFERQNSGAISYFTVGLGIIGG